MYIKYTKIVCSLRALFITVYAKNVTKIYLLPDGGHFITNDSFIL